jgi:hypothetical protein
MPKKKYPPKPNVGTYLDQIISYLKWERKKIPSNEKPWLIGNNSVLLGTQVLKRFFTGTLKPRRCRAGFPYAVPKPLRCKAGQSY